MKTRSSRFFVILLHLLGVSNHHLPSWYYDYLTSSTSSDRAPFYSGIRGVHPHSIVLERLDLREVGGLDGVEWLEKQGRKDSDSISSHQRQQQQQPGESNDSATQIVREPFWLQDTQDGQCLGPNGGFSECGDATLWFVLRRGTERKSLRMGPFGVEEVLERVDPEEPYRYALQIVDNDYLQQTPSPSTSTTVLSSFSLSWRQKRQQRRQRDCLVPSTNNSRRKLLASDVPSLELGSCAKQNTAWSWRVDSQGFLYLPKDVSRTKGRKCLRRTQASSAVLSSCQDANEDFDSKKPQQRLVQFSLVRYHATSNPSLASSHASDTDQAKARPMTPLDTKRSSQRINQDAEHKRKDGTGGLPSTRDIAHSHASEPVMHSPIFEMNLASRPLLSNIPSREAREGSNSSPFAALKDSNPILFLGADMEGRQLSADSSKKITTNNKNSRLGKAAATPPMSAAAPVKLRKIEMNPYIAASNDELWVDPQTGLEYQTDLCRYLGHDRKESGRHTLVGVGQYMKTMLKIKVYGIALYVSKRDVLADPSFQEYAGLSAEELRNRPDFYVKLRTMSPSSADPSEGGRFDRTLLLKTNMQLSTENMRSSLDSDWKLLSEEAKALLIDTSMRPRPAEEQMLQEIQRADNPSRCSCSQVAPEALQADTSCCARGIELVFTWRKNGNLEVRLNGRLMDAFPRPDIGYGIFFEYLRLDDPFSLDFIERAVDGFPHLLSPLAQVQGITSPVMHAAPKSSGRSFFRTFSNVAETFSSQAAGVAGAMQHAAGEAAANAAQAAQSASDAMRHLGGEAERRRHELWKQLVEITHQNPAEVFERKRQDVWKEMVEMSHQNPAEVFAQFSAQILATGERQTEEAAPVEPEPQDDRELRHAPHGRFFRLATSKWFGETLEAPDEIGPMIHPTMNKTILSLVHLYLLLILIVSFPPTNSSRTRFVVRRSCKLMSVSSSESSLIKRIENGRDSMLHLKEKNKSRLLLDKQNTRGTGKKVAPEPPGTDDTDVEMHPEDDSDPASHGNSPQRIRIDLSLQDRMECKERGLSKGNKRFSSRVRRSASTQGVDCAESASVKSSVSDGSGGRNRSKKGKKKDLTNDKMKKSLSYFL